MKTLAFAAAFLCTGAFASAQQVSLLGDESGGASKTSSVTEDGMPQVLVPKDEQPAVVPPVPVPAAAASPQKKPVKKVINKKNKSAAVAVSSAAETSRPVVPVTAAAPAAAKPAGKSSAPAAFPFEAVKPEELPAAVLAGKAAPAKPAEAVKPAAEVKPVQAVKPAEAVKPAAAAKPASAVVQAPPAGAGAGFEVGKTHTVTGGDTLWDLSGKYYKDPYKWGKIYNANLGTVANPDRIYPKEELIIPGLTEEVKPAAGKAPEITGGDTVKEAEFTGSDVPQAEEASAPAAAAAPAKTAEAQLGDMLKEFDANDLSEEMPEHQKEWSAGVMIVPDSWKEDGVVSAAEGGEEHMASSLSEAGDAVLITMTAPAGVKKGDYLSVYMKGATAYDKAGQKLGREIQRAGTLRVTSVDGKQVQTEVIEALTGIIKGYVVKKK